MPPDDQTNPLSKALSAYADWWNRGGVSQYLPGPLHRSTGFEPQDVAMSFAPGDLGGAAAGIIAGRHSLTANHRALALAEQMAAQGHDPGHIYSKTGWFQGADNKWRYEIPDDTSKYSPDDVIMDAMNKHPEMSDAQIAKALDERGVKASTKYFLEHPELYAAYPDLARLETHWRPESQMQGYNGFFNPLGIGLNAGLADETAHSVLLHELQHGVQNIEGFATGANPDAIADDLMKRFGVSKDQVEKYANELYRQTAGEVEARNVQTRQSFTPEERALVPPVATEDVPRQQQIVLDRDGKPVTLTPVDHDPFAASADLPMDEASRLARANALGYTIDAYHGTLGPGMTRFHEGTHFGTSEAANQRLTDVQELPSGARPYGHPTEGAEQPAVYPVRLRVKKPFEMEDTGEFDAPAFAFKMRKEGIINDEQLNAMQEGELDPISILRNKGYDAVKYINNHEDRGSISYMMLDPSGIRSRFARFDPTQTNEPYIMGSK